MKFRSFLNSDPPGLAALWQLQQSRAIANHVSPPMLEDYVFARPYFDKDGLIIAEDDGRIVGFSHAAFGPNADRSDIDTDAGVICLTMVSPQAEFAPMAAELIRRAEEYLQGRGSKLLYAGGVYPLNPFYLGFYGGSELPGVIASDNDSVTAYEQAGYQEIDRCHIMCCELPLLHAPIDRKMLQNKRLYSVRRRASGPAANWWEACTRPPTETTVFEIVSNADGQSCGSVTFWLIEPLSTSRGTPVVGLTRLGIDESLQRQGLATFLNSAALKALKEAGIHSVEVQTMQSNKAALGLYKKLGFQHVEDGLILRKS